MNVLYLLKTLDTTKLSELVQAMDMPPLDFNIVLWDALDRGEIEVDEEKDSIKALKEAETWHNPDISTKVLRVIQQYARNQSNVTAGRLNGYMKDPMSGKGYPLHEYLMSVQYLIDTGQIIEEVIEVPEKSESVTNKRGKTKKKVIRPKHKFVFLCLPENGENNAEWNAKAVNKWISEFDNAKIK